jgi:hypothetical protein
MMANRLRVENGNLIDTGWNQFNQQGQKTGLEPRINPIAAEQI